MLIAYREGRLADAAAIADVFQRAFTDTFGHLYQSEDLKAFLATMTAEQFRQDLSDPRFQFRLACEGDELVGFIKLGPPELPVETPPDTIELCQLYVLERWQGAGVAPALMDWALSQAREQQAGHVQLSVYVDNHRARSFYRRYGFKTVGRYDFMVGNHADEDVVLRHVVMESAP